jgi:hypothetical protein
VNDGKVTVRHAGDRQREKPLNGCLQRDVTARSRSASKATAGDAQAILDESAPRRLRDINPCMPAGPAMSHQGRLRPRRPWRRIKPTPAGR